MTDEQRAKLKRGLALFDLDGTLIAWDTQMLLCDLVLKHDGRRRAYLALFAAFLPLARVLGAEGMKRVFLSYLWRMERRELAARVDELVATYFPARCYPELLRELQLHREAGHLTVLASASPEFYVQAVARALGFDLALGTPVEIGERVPLFPDLRNHKGEEKVRRLSLLFGAPPADGWPLSHGYSDSSADLPMLSCCRRNTLINPSARLAAIGRDKGWTILTPAKPWRGKIGHAVEVLRRIAGI